MHAPHSHTREVYADPEVPGSERAEMTRNVGADSSRENAFLKAPVGPVGESEASMVQAEVLFGCRSTVLSLKALQQVSSSTWSL